MTKRAARISDKHICPMETGSVPHVGGPISGPGEPTVLIGGLPAATVGDACVCSGPPDTIAVGSTSVLIGGRFAARVGDGTAHGGKIVVGCSTVFIGDESPSSGTFSAVESIITGTTLVTFPFSAAVAGAVAGAYVPGSTGTTGSIAGVTATHPPVHSKVRAWFQAQLTYEDGAPVTYVRYELTLPDGSATRRGRSDCEGMIREGSLPPGQCKLTLGDLDKDLWGGK